MRRTELKRRARLKPGKGLARTGRLRPVSAKRRATNRVRRDVLNTLLELRGYTCEAKVPDVCTGTVQCGHELVKRSHGGSITDPDNILLTCWPCNSWVEDHPARAYELGLWTPTWEADA